MWYSPTLANLSRPSLALNSPPPCLAQTLPLLLLLLPRRPQPRLQLQHLRPHLGLGLGRALETSHQPQHQFQLSLLASLPAVLLRLLLLFPSRLPPLPPRPLPPPQQLPLPAQHPRPLLHLQAPDPQVLRAGLAPTKETGTVLAEPPSNDVPVVHGLLPCKWPPAHRVHQASRPSSQWPSEPFDSPGHMSDEASIPGAIRLRCPFFVWNVLVLNFSFLLCLQDQVSLYRTPLVSLKCDE